MTNTKLLNQYIVNSGIKKGKIASALGVSYNALWQKTNNKRDFKASEIQILCEMLGIDSLQVKEEIFFA